MMNFKALLKTYILKVIQKYPWVGDVLIPALRYYRGIKYRLTQWPQKKPGKDEHYFVATYRLYEQFQASQNKKVK